MVSSVTSFTSAASGNVAKMADSIFSKLDTKKQGYIEKSDLATALTAASGDKKDGAANVDDAFSALDGDGDGKVTKSELTTAMTKVADGLNAQFDASRVAGGMPPGGGAGGPRGHGDGDGDGGKGSATSSTSSTTATTTYDAAADANGDGTVSAEEEAAYKKVEASGGATSSTSGADSTSGASGLHRHGRDPMHELAHALNLLKAYADNSGDTSASGSAGADSTSSTTGISVTA